MERKQTSFFQIKPFVRRARSPHLSMSETTAAGLVVEGEDEKQRKAVKIRAEIDKNELDPDQCNETIGRYNREFLYNIRDLEKLLSVTPCPKDPEQLETLGVCPFVLHRLERWYDRMEYKRLHKNDPEWIAMEEEKLKEERRRGAIWSKLKKSDSPWRVVKISETEEDKDLKAIFLIRKACAFFNKVTPTNFQSLIEEFLGYKVYSMSGILLSCRIVMKIIDLAVEKPNFIKLLSEICFIQIRAEKNATDKEVYELKNSWSEGSRFRNALNFRVLGRLFLKEGSNDARIYEKKHRGLLDEMRRNLRREKAGMAKFLGHLFLREICSIPFILNCINQLIPSVEYTEAFSINAKKHIHIDCVLQLLKLTGKKLHEENLAAVAAGRPEVFPFESLFATLKKTMPVVGNRLRNMIMILMDLRANGWMNDKVDEDDLGFGEQYETAQVNDKDKKIQMLEIKLLDEMDRNSMLTKKLLDQNRLVYDNTNLTKELNEANKEVDEWKAAHKIWIDRMSAKEEEYNVVEKILEEQVEKNSILSQELERLKLAKNMEKPNEESWEKSEDEIKEGMKKVLAELKESHVESEKIEGAEGKVDEVDLGFEEQHDVPLTNKVRALFNKVTPTNFESLTQEFLSYKVYESPDVNKVASIIIDLAVENIKFSHLYSKLCYEQVQDELKKSSMHAFCFRNTLLFHSQDKYHQRESVFGGDETQRELTEKRRMEKIGIVTFLGNLYLTRLISVRILLFCVVDLLKSVTEKSDDSPLRASDEHSIECAVQLLKVVGKRLDEDNRAYLYRHLVSPLPQSVPSAPFPLDKTFQTLEHAASFVSDRVRLMISDLVEFRKMGWRTIDENKIDIEKEMN